MASSREPGASSKKGPVGSPAANGSDADLHRRRRALETSLAATRAPGPEEQHASGRAAASGYGQAFKLSSEFIAAIAVGVGLGWGIDRLAGTSPWGLIVFLLLGFAAGVLNVLRSAGMVAQPGLKAAKKGAKEPDEI